MNTIAGKPLKVTHANWGPVKAIRSEDDCAFSAKIDGESFEGTYDPRQTRSQNGGGTHSVVTGLLGGRTIRCFQVKCGKPFFGTEGICGIAITPVP